MTGERAFHVARVMYRMARARMVPGPLSADIGRFCSLVVDLEHIAWMLRRDLNRLLSK